MRIVNHPCAVDKYFYRTDLEKYDTLYLINALRRCRARQSRFNEQYEEDDEGNLIVVGDYNWCIFHSFENGSGDWEYHHTMPWMIKSVLANRPHIYKSKGVRRARRQYQAKHHVKFKMD